MSRSALLTRIVAKMRPAPPPDSDDVDKSESSMTDLFKKSDMPLPDLLTTMPDLPIRATQLPLALPPTTPTIAQVADQAAAAAAFAQARSRLADETRRRHMADLALFSVFLAEAQITAVDLATNPAAWTGLSWGLVEAFVRWQVQAGYAMGSINVRLTTVKRYARLAVQAGTLSAEAYALIAAVRGFRGAEGRRMDAERTQTRTGRKKAEPTLITSEQLRQLKQLGDERQQLVLCLLLDHGLRVGEVALLQPQHFDLQRGMLRFYRPKVDKQQLHRLSTDTLAAAQQYLPGLPQTIPIFPGTRQLNRLVAAAGQQIGLTPLSPHDCRHAWATRATQAGTPLKALQDAGGWSSPAMPLRYAASSAIANDGLRLD